MMLTTTQLPNIPNHKEAYYAHLSAAKQHAPHHTPKPKFLEPTPPALTRLKQ